MSPPLCAQPLPAFSSLLAFAVPCWPPPPVSIPQGPALAFPPEGSLPGRFLIFPLNCYCKGHAPRSEMNHLVIISGVPSGFPTAGPRRLGRLWGVCARSAVRGSIAPPCGRAAGRWRPSWAWAMATLGLPVSGGEVSEAIGSPSGQSLGCGGSSPASWLSTKAQTQSGQSTPESYCPLCSPATLGGKQWRGALAKEGSRVQVRLLRV